MKEYFRTGKGTTLQYVGLTRDKYSLACLGCSSLEVSNKWSEGHTSEAEQVLSS